LGLYFNRARPKERDLECNPATAKRPRLNKLQVYATIILVLIWINFLRFLLVFSRNDHFGALLFMKIIVFTWHGLISVFQTTLYYASHSGRLVKVLKTLPVTRECVRRTRRYALFLTALTWSLLIGYMTVGFYFFVNSKIDERDYILSPFVTYIPLSENEIRVGSVIAFVVYILVFLNVFFSHAMNKVILYVFYSQFKDLKKKFRRALGERGRFNGDLSLFRQRHQTLSRAVSKIDDFMKHSNVAGFVCHMANTILMLYSMMFFPEATHSFTTVVVHLFWLVVNVNGLALSASAGVIINHMVGTQCM